MISENGNRMTMFSQLHCLVEKHGLENVAQSLIHLCHEQSLVNSDKAIEKAIGHLEKLVDSSCLIKDWK